MTAVLTATWSEVEKLDAAEQILVTGWAHHLRHGQTARFVAALIVTAVHYEPRLGLPMDVCDRHGCSVFVDEQARDHDGRLFCSPDCEDAAAEASFEQWERLNHGCAA